MAVEFTAEANPDKPGVVTLNVEGGQSLNPDEAYTVADALREAADTATNELARCRHEGTQHYVVVRGPKGGAKVQKAD